MESELGAELLGEIRETFNELVRTDKAIQRRIEKIAAGRGTMFDATQYAYGVGQNLTKAFLANLTETRLPNGRIYYSLANEIVPPMLQEEFGLTTETAQKIITDMNRRAGINLNGIVPDINQSRIDGIVSGIGNSETLEDAYKYLRGPVQNFAVHAVDDTVRRNLDFQHESGMRPKIVRSTNGPCCPWCDALAGEYDYPASNPEVWQRHENCNCVIEYQPTKIRAPRQRLSGYGWQNGRT